METDRITTDVRVRWGTPCIRDTGISVAHIVGLSRSGVPIERILDDTPDLEASDVEAALGWFSARGADGLYPQPPPPGERYPRITVDRAIQGGRPCIRGTRLTVDAVCAMAEGGFTVAGILDEYPGLEAEDVRQALAYDAEARR